MEILKRNSDYALRAIAHLASLKPGAVAPASAIGRAERIPEPLLRKLLQELCRAKVVASQRGVRGGFRLAKPADAITLLEVVEAVQGKLTINRCFLGKDLCANQSLCSLRGQLTAVQGQLTDIFKGITLADVVGEKGPLRNKSARAMPAGRKARSK